MVDLSALKKLNLMNKLSDYYYIVEVDGVRYAVKYGKLDEFICLFCPQVVTVLSLTTGLSYWKHGYEWYKRI